METTSRFQSRLLSEAKRSRRRQSPLALLDNMRTLVQRIFLPMDGEMRFIGKPEDIRQLCARLFLAAGLAGVDLGLAVRQKYPGFCPYCDNTLCQCEPVKPRPHRRWQGRVPEEGSTADLQNMLEAIYPNDAKNVGQHAEKLLEEINEARQALRESPLVEINEELADIFAWLASLALKLNMPLC